jgi:hypothetical protein
MKMGKDKEMGGGQGAPGILSSYGFCLVLFAFMLMDFVPRFYQGDSTSYLMTGYNGLIPPDRSWAFGFVSGFIFRHTHGFSAFMLIQVGFFACLIAATRVFFSDFGRSRTVYGVIAVLLALDPFLEINTRFFMSDFSAVVAFLAVLFALFFLLRAGDRTRSLWFWTFLAIVGTVVAVFIRVAYALIIELTVLLVGIILSRRLARRQLFALAVVALAPFIAVSSVVIANRIVFADLFPHETFVVKLSGVLLASIFAPALQMSDFHKVGIPITTSEFQSLDLKNYERRSDQVWVNSPDRLNQFIMDKLKIKQFYSKEVDKTASGLFWNALKRNPIALVKIYAWSAFQYTKPSCWHQAVYEAMGLTRTFPSHFIPFANRYSLLKIEPGITKYRSLLVRLNETVSYVYPLLLLLGLTAGGYLMIMERAKPSVVVLTAGLLADLAPVPMYSFYVVGRYLLGAIIISYLLVGLAVQSFMIRRALSS